MLGGSVVIFNSETRALVLCIRHQLSCIIAVIIPHSVLFKYLNIYMVLICMYVYIYVHKCNINIVCALFSSYWKYNVRNILIGYKL